MAVLLLSYVAGHAVAEWSSITTTPPGMLSQRMTFGLPVAPYS